MTAGEALQRLRDGNARFVSGVSCRRVVDRDWLANVAFGQNPFATILGCSDSRVPPEIVFDQGLGELFIVRVAGNVVKGAGPPVKADNTPRKSMPDLNPMNRAAAIKHKNNRIIVSTARQ